jgi:TetR/AcrR family transcriptional repressor of nem operon
MSKAENTKKFIIEKTAVIFNKKGYAGTSLTDLTRATRLTKGGIYGNFKNKDEVAVQTYNHNVNKITGAFSKEIEAAGSSYEKLMAYPRVYRRIYKAIFTDGGCPILNTLTDSDDTHPFLFKMAVATINSWKKSIIRIVEQGIQDQEFRPEVNPAQIAEILISLFEGGGILARSCGDESFFLSVLTHTEELIEHIRK